MSHFDYDFLFYFSDDFFLVYDRNFNNFFFNNFVWNKFFYDFGYIDFTFLSVCDEARNFSIEIDSLSVGDEIGNLTLYLNVSIFLEYFLIDHFDFLYFLPSLSYVNRFLNYLFYFNILLRSCNLHWLFNLHNLASLYNNLFIILHLDNLLFIQRHNLLNLNIIQFLVYHNFLHNNLTNCWNLNYFLVLELNFNILSC